MPKALELTGRKFNMLTVIKRVENTNGGCSQWLCMCDCGETVKVAASHLKNGHTKSCNCLQKIKASGANKTHGHHGTGIYNSWASMLQRCNNPNTIEYKYYGGRGITVCARWAKFENFLKDMGVRPVGLALDRINNNGNYEPNNCRWTTQQEQVRNSRQTKLNPLKVQVIKKLLKESCLKHRQIAEIFNIACSMISHINTGKNWRDIIYT